MNPFLMKGNGDKQLKYSKFLQELGLKICGNRSFSVEFFLPQSEDMDVGFIPVLALL